MEIIEYSLSADRLCLGERVKGGTYRPCSRVIAYTRVTAALESTLGLTAHAVGVIESVGAVSHLTIGPIDRGKGTIKLPIKVMFLEEVKGRIYLLKDGISGTLHGKMTLLMGGLRMKGMGKCLLYDKREYGIGLPDFRDGTLITRIPVPATEMFKIRVLKEKLGYLFTRDNDETGRYVLSYFEGSYVRGPKFLLEGGGNER